MNKQQGMKTRTFWDLFTLLWCLFAVLELSLMFYVPGTAYHDNLVSPLLRISSLSYELVVLVIPTLLLTCLLLCPVKLLAGKMRRFLIFRLPVALVFLLAVWLLLLFFAMSWGLFFVSQHFIGLSGLAMLHNDPIQIVQHALQINPWAFIIAMAASLLFTMLIYFLCSKWHRSEWPASKRVLRLVCVLLITVVTLITAVGSLYAGTSKHFIADKATGIQYTTLERFRSNSDDRTGPYAFFVADLMRIMPWQHNQQFAKGNFPIKHRPIISMQQYLSGVDHSAIKRRNVIVVLIESMRADQLLRYDGHREVMPNVEGLAERSMIYNNAYAQASHSNYADLAPLSSRYPLYSRTTYFYPKNPSYPRVLIYDILKHLGYKTAVFSSQNEYWGNMINYLRTGNIDYFLHAETYQGPNNVPRQKSDIKTSSVVSLKWIQGDKRAGKIDDRYTVGEAIKWIDKQGKQPFFIYMNLQNSHFPYELPADFKRRYTESTSSAPSRLNVDKKNSQLEMITDQYSDSLAYVDMQLGRLFTHLKQRGLWNNTIIVVTADTATELMEHGNIGNAGSLYNEIIKVPLIIHAPDLTAGVDRRLVQHIDVPPTVLSLLGLPDHPSFQGINLFAENYPSERSVFAVAQTPFAHQYAIINSGMKLLYDVPKGRYILYDLKTDPKEQQDIAKNNRAVVKALSDKLSAWIYYQLMYHQDRSWHSKEYPPSYDR